MEWPATLPQLKIGLTDERQDARVRTQMDAGPYKIRRKFTAAFRTIATTMTLTGAQRKTLDSFYIDDLGEGVIPFNWRDPVDNSTVEFRFVKPISYSLVKGSDPDTDPTGNDRLWTAGLNLEIMP